jgi:LPS O-antigen subunit length determinant protein (WzzB/FepE family)
MEQLMELMDEGKLPTELAEGFSAQQLIEVKELSADIASEEDAVTQAVQILSNLASLKLKVQESRAEALKVRAQVDILFSDRAVSEEEIASLKEGFKVLKSFAQINLRYQEARSKAEDARNVLDRALKSPDASGEVVTPTTPGEEAKSESLSPRAELRPVPKKP